jgi:hypothetical protein
MLSSGSAFGAGFKAVNKILGVLTASALSLAAGGALAQANLVSNGGFETGDFTGWTESGPDFCVGASFACDGYVFPADPGPHSGTYAAYLGADGPGGTDDLLGQTLTTTAGQGYYLQFFLAAPTVFGGYSPSQFTVEWDGDVVDAIVNLANNSYVEYSFWVRGTGSDTLLFDAYNAPGVFVLDDVSVTSAPEPAAFVLLLVGMTAVGVAARRRRRAS